MEEVVVLAGRCGVVWNRPTWNFPYKKEGIELLMVPVWWPFLSFSHVICMKV